MDPGLFYVISDGKLSPWVGKLSLGKCEVCFLSVFMYVWGVLLSGAE